MPSAISNGARIRTNTPAESAYNALDSANKSIAVRQLRLSTGKRINSASDDVAGFITSRALQGRVGTLRGALDAVGDAQNVGNIAQDGLDNVASLVTLIKDSASSAASGSLGTDEKVALAKAAFRLTQQVQTVVDSTVFGGRQLLAGGFSAEFVIGSNASNSLLTLGIDLTTGNADFNVSGNNFNINNNSANFAGVTGLNLMSLNDVSASNLGVFASSSIQATLTSLTSAIDNISKVSSYLGGVSNRLSSQSDSLNSQITNYNAAISRIQDTDVAKEQLELVRSQFLQQASLVSLSQANQAPQTFLSLFR